MWWLAPGVGNATWGVGDAKASSARGSGLHQQQSPDDATKGTISGSVQVWNAISIWEKLDYATYSRRDHDMIKDTATVAGLDILIPARVQHHQLVCPTDQTHMPCPNAPGGLKQEGVELETSDR
jgi:hypothetical protein